MACRQPKVERSVFIFQAAVNCHSKSVLEISIPEILFFSTSKIYTSSVELMIKLIKFAGVVIKLHFHV